MVSTIQKPTPVPQKPWQLKLLPNRLVEEAIKIVSSTRNLAQDDPRRVTHSLKVGLALTLVSLFYYYQPLYDNFGVSAMWAVITVVVVFEFTVGATLGKGLNRATATLLAGALGVGAHHLAGLCGKLGEPILIAFFVFLQAAASTFIRFFPKVKARYDYGFVIFILTFSFISITGFREDQILELAHRRLSAILMGGFASIFISISVYPVWAGEDLHNMVVLNIEKLGNFLEAFSVAYFGALENGVAKNDIALLQGYKSVLNSKSIEETLANLARWEPPHGRFKFRHPWKQYLKVGSLVRDTAYRIDALSAYLNLDMQSRKKVQEQIREPCKRMSLESGEVLKLLAAAVRTMAQPPSSIDVHIANSKAAAKSLKTFLGSAAWGVSHESVELLKVMMPVATVASLLIDIVESTEKIAEAVNVLASLAHFEKVEAVQLACQSVHNHTSSNSNEGCCHVVIVVNEVISTTSERDEMNSAEVLGDDQHVED